MSIRTDATDAHDIGWRFDNSYARLPEAFFVQAKPAEVPSPRLVIANYRLAEELGVDLRSLSEEQLAQLFAGQVLPEGSDPIAQAYAGHQFGGFTMLGDGRAILLAQHRTPAGQLVDIQFKGSGRTHFSRGGDGLAALGPMLREYLISEAMHALGIPTTRSLAVVTTGKLVRRDELLPGAILTRVASSHIRVGTFQYAAARGDVANLQTLADYAIGRHYPQLAAVADGKYREFLRAVIEQQAKLVAQWQCVGFVHGVMNTDNMTISGETIDYGPCAFMDHYHDQTVFSSIDHGGRYAYGNQPNIALWNLSRFAEALLPLLEADLNAAVEQATAELEAFSTKFRGDWLTGMRKKLGLGTEESEDLDLIQALLVMMQEAGADFTNTFRELSCSELPTREFFHSAPFRAWYATWEKRRQRDRLDRSQSAALMNSVNPDVVPRNHRVEEALAAASHDGDLEPLDRLLAALETPYECQASHTQYCEPPPPSFGRYQTFCGT